MNLTQYITKNKLRYASGPVPNNHSVTLISGQVNVKLVFFNVFIIGSFQYLKVMRLGLKRLQLSVDLSGWELINDNLFSSDKIVFQIYIFLFSLAQ